MEFYSYAEKLSICDVFRAILKIIAGLFGPSPIGLVSRRRIFVSISACLGLLSIGIIGIG